MDEARYIDWYDVVQAVANGRSDGHACPECGASGLESSADGVTVRVRCPACGQGFSGRLAHGRDDALHAEAAALVERGRRGDRTDAERTEADRAAVVAGGLCATGPEIGEVALTATVLAAPPATPNRSTPVAPPARASATAPVERPEPWNWTLPAGTGDDVEALSQWMTAVESIHNGRTLGLSCPFCSEPLTDITHRPPYIRVACGVCGEAFEGRLG